MSHIRRNPTALPDPKVSVVIPVYNEKNTICEILRRVEETEMRKEIVVVDDCSIDGTREILRDLPWPPATSCWCKTRTWNTTHAIIRSCWSRSWKAWQTWCTARGFWAARS